MRSLVTVSLVLLCFMDHSDGTFTDFMNNLPSEISKAFSIAWGSLEDAVRKPVRIKRLGKGRNPREIPQLSVIITQLLKKLKTTTTRPFARPFEIKRGHPLPESSSRSGRKLIIPHLQTPPRIITLGNRRYILTAND